MIDEENKSLRPRKIRGLTFKEMLELAIKTDSYFIFPSIINPFANPFNLERYLSPQRAQQ